MVDPAPPVPAAEAVPAPPCTLVVFGAAGDLSRRLLFPALYNLSTAKLLPERFAVIGIARNDIGTAAFRRDLAASTREFATAAVMAETWRWLSDRIYYLRGDFAAAETYERLSQFLPELEAVHHTGGNALFYLATPPAFFATIIGRLGEAGLVREGEGSLRRVIVEKPFGTDLGSAQALNRAILDVLSE